jgi:hypothetical protein
MKALQMLGIAVIALLAWPRLAGAQHLTPIPGREAARTQPQARLNPAGADSPWTPLTNQPNFLADGAANPILLTDGTVLVQDAGFPDWWRLTPDQNGSYVNGTWTQVASLPPGYSPLYHSSAVLPDGRLIVEGGEYLLNSSQTEFVPSWTAMGAIYDPLADAWTSVAPPSFFGGFGPFPQTIGDAQSVVLANGTYMQADCCTNQDALLDPKTLTWTATGAGKFDIHDEEGWTLLPNKQVLTVDAYVGQYNPTGMNSEFYNPASGKWHSAGSTAVQLWDSAANCGGTKVASFEVGPAVLRPDGTVFYTGANSCGAGHTAIYNSNTGTWTVGPDFPDTLDIADGPASLLPSGNVLVDTSPGIFNTPTSFFEFDGTNLNSVAGPPNAPIDSSYYGNMLILPTGQVLFTDFSNDIEIYTSTGTYNPAWAPRIRSAPASVSPGGSYVISGHLFDGLSQGAAYGDDVQAATNYPLVRITNRTTGHVFYSRTHDHSSMAVAFGGLVSTHLDVPADQELGISDLVVVANGIPSRSVTVNVQ